MQLNSGDLLITDIGGVLLKTDEAIVGAIGQVFDRNKIEKGSRESMLDVFGVGIWDYIFNYLPGKYVNEERQLMANWLYEEFTHVYPDKVKDKLRVFDGVEETLNLLVNKGVQLAVISCMNRYQVEVNLSLLEFENWSDVLAMEDYKRKRPDPAGLKKIMERVGQP